MSFGSVLTFCTKIFIEMFPTKWALTDNHWLKWSDENWCIPRDKWLKSDAFMNVTDTDVTIVGFSIKSGKKYSAF